MLTPEALRLTLKGPDICDNGCDWTCASAGIENKIIAGKIIKEIFKSLGR